MPKKNTITFDAETIHAVRPSLIRPVFERAEINEIKSPGAIPRHQHMKYEVIFVDCGVYRCTHNDCDVTLDRNWILVVKPGDWHTDIFDGTPLRYMGLGFSLQMTSGVPAPIFREGIPADKQHFRADCADFLQLFEKIRTELQRGDFASPHIQDAIVSEFLFRMLRVMPRDILSEQYFPASNALSFQSNLLAVINERLNRKADVAEMAFALGMSQSALAHKCREILQCSPANLFKRAKMDRAMQMLKSTDMQVKEVSDYLGFDNQFHFSRAFKKTFGKSPSDVKDDPTPPPI